MAREFLNKLVDKSPSEDMETDTETQNINPEPLEEQWTPVNKLLCNNVHLLQQASNQTEESKIIVSTVKETVHLIESSMKTMTSTTSEFNELLTSMSQLLEYDHIDIDMRFSIVKILTFISEKNLYRLESRNFVNVVCFLMENCCLKFSEKQMAPFLRILKKLSNSSERENSIKLACLIEKGRVLKSLKKVLKADSFCASDVGVDIIGFYISMDEEFIKIFHDHVTHKLISCKKKNALKYGKTYFRIWENLPEDERQRFEEDYLQWYMERACTLDRIRIAQRNLSVNVQNVLKGLHLSRKLAKFSSVITNLYTPILWKYLNSDNNIHRSNAAEIFMDAYPLEKPGKGMKSYSQYLRKQHDEILDLLDDPCPTVRVIAIKGACSNMRYFWITFQNGTAELIIKKFAVDLISDSSSGEVRRSVYQGITQLLECSEAHDLLKFILPSLGSYIHDENQGVRQAFLIMLIKLKELNCKIKYHNIVDMENIAARLADDTPKNRQLIVHLIFSSFFNERLSMEDSIGRVCKFVKVNPTAGRYLAMYSGNSLEFETAISFMNFSFDKLKTRVTGAMRCGDDENVEGDKESENDFIRRGRSNSSQSVLTNIENLNKNDKTGDSSVSASYRNRTSINNSELNRSVTLDEPRIAHGLLDFIGMLWLIHGKTLQKKENKELLEELYCHAQNCIPVVLRYFRGTHAFFGALNLAGLIPLSRLIDKTTVVSTCKSILCSINSDTPSNEIHCIIHTLCMWNKAREITDLSREWLDEAFRSVNLNESLAISRAKTGKKVKFFRVEPNPFAALRVLDELFSSPSDQKLIFSKNSDELKELFVFLSRIKILIEQRIECGSPISEVLNDDLILQCLELYGNLIIMFDENHVENFNFWKQFPDYLKWFRSLLSKCNESTNYEKLSDECDAFFFEVMRVPLRQCVNVIALGKCKNKELITVLKFVQATLDSDCGVYMIELSLHIIKQLILYLQTHPNEPQSESEVMNAWFPTIMSKILDILTEKAYSKETITKFVKDVPCLKKNLLYVLLLSLKLHPKLTHSSPSYKIMSSFCRSLINIVLFPITECETLNVDQKLKNLPFIGSMMASIFISQLELSSALLFVLKTIIERLTETDGLTLLACSSLLYSFAFSPGKVRTSEVMKVVRSTYVKIQSIPAEGGFLVLALNPNRTVNDRTIIDIEETTESALKEIGIHILQKVAEKLEGSLPKMSDDVPLQ